MAEYKTELHMHTAEVSPCGMVKASEGIRIYKKLGYHTVAVTDHFKEKFFSRFDNLSWKQKVDKYLEGYRLAYNEGLNQGVKVILGMEYCIPGKNDDILIYGFDEQFLYENENLYTLDESGLKEKARKYNLLLIQAHPFRPAISKVYDKIIEGLEVFNGNPRHDSHNDRAFEYAWQNQWISISGSDFHRATDAGMGGVYLPLIPENSRELADILRSIKTPRLITSDLSFQKTIRFRIRQRIKRFIRERSKELNRKKELGRNSKN